MIRFNASPSVPSASSTNIAPSRPQGRITIVELVLVLFVYFFISYRLVSLPLLIFALWSSRPAAKLWSVLFGWAIFVLSLVSPYDIRIPQLSTVHYGTPAQGVRIVPYVVGMPMRTLLIEKYGEFYGGRCGGPCLYAPRWIISVNLLSSSDNPRTPPAMSNPEGE
jgi:hypothetical protein